MNHADALKPYAANLVDTLMALVRIENEDNAVLCMKTIMDLERYQTEATANKVQPFLDLIQEMFETMEQVVKDTFDIPSQATVTGNTPNNVQAFQSPRPGSPSASVSSDLSIDMQSNRPLLLGMQSFKVFSECPIIVVSLFQAHRNCVPSNVKKFVPLIKLVLMLQAKPQEKEHAEAEKRGEIFTGVSKDIKNRGAFGEFITAQVKMMSFLAYLLRVYYGQLTDFLPTLPDIVVRLLRDCPSEKSATRKELLVAIRHTINFNFRKIFLTKIDDLLDDRTLIGDGLTVYETMRPLAYSLLADLIHHVRESLNPDQIRRTVDVFSRSLHDNFPGTSFQTMSARLLLNMADSIARLDKKDARHFLIIILSAIGDKFAAMNREYLNAVKQSKDYEQQTIDAVPEDHLADADNPPMWDEVDIFGATPIKTSNPKDRGANPIEDNKFLFKNLLGGLKGMFFQLKACNSDAPAIDNENAPANWQEVSYGYGAEEVKVITKLFREGAYVFRYYKPSTETPYSSPVEFLANHYMVQSGREEKELLEIFATVFHSIDPATFHEVFHSEIPRLYEMMFEHTALLHIPQFFLASEATSPSFAGMLLQFLMDHIRDVGSKNPKQSSILLRMFKLSFMAVTLFSAQNEQVLLPHVTSIVTKSIQLSVTADEPMNYFYLLRSLFRAIGGGRFELLYKEILPLLEMLLEVLNNLLLAARKPQERDLYVELCLTVPARLSNLLPHLSYLMRPLVIALRAGSDLVGQGLRTLELCVDNLTAEYLDPIMAPVIDELMTALWDHLRPYPYSPFHSHTTMRILGKLGGRNRKFLNGPPKLSFRPFADDESSFDIKLIGSNKERPFPANIGIELAISKLMETPKAASKKMDTYYKQQALRLVVAHIKTYIGFDGFSDDFAQTIRYQACSFVEGSFDEAPDISLIVDREKSVSKRDAQAEILKKLLKALMLAAALPELAAFTSTFLIDVCRHFTILELGRALLQAKQNSSAFNVKVGEGLLFIDSRVLAEAIAESLASDNAALRETAEGALKTVHEFVLVIFGQASHAERFPFFLHLAKIFCHRCYEEEWYTKAGGALGIHLFTTTIDLGESWLADRQMDFIRALIFVMKDMPQDLPASVRIQAMETMEVLLRKCNKNIATGESGIHQNRLSQLSGFLVYELAHMSKHVREAAQKAFAIIAEMAGVEVHDLLIPVKDRLLQHIFSKPLRALPFAPQIGYIEAITYCLSLHRNLVEFNDLLNRLLMESLSLADAEDEVLAPKPNEYRTAQSIVSLRVSCIKLLSLAVGYPEFAGQQQTQIRSRIISVFFKSLYSHSQEVIEAANAGLKGILLQTNKLPKDLLQNGLRPILMNLQDPKRLTVQGLDGLARLLALLTNYFKVEIGDRLLTHMTIIADPVALQKSSFTLIEQNPQMRIVVAILNIFHLLPTPAASFMNDLVDKVLELESSLRRTHLSPFREPLSKFLSRYPKDSWTYFSAKLSEMKYGRFFAQNLLPEGNAPIRDVVIADIQGLISSSFNLEDEVKRDTASINAIHIVHSLRNHGKDWLIKEENLRQSLLTIAVKIGEKKNQNKILPDLRLAADQAIEQVMDIFISYLEQASHDLDFLFQLIEAVTADRIKKFPSLLGFIYNRIVCNDSPDCWRSVVMRCIELYTAHNSSQDMKTFVFRNLVNPIFMMDVSRSSSNLDRRFMDKSIVEAIHTKLWKPQLIDLNEDNRQPGVDHSRLELLQMSALLLKYHHNLVSEARKDIIKFGWSYIRLEDTINKHAAYVLIGFFIARFDTPAKIVNQIYVSLLKAHQNEGRTLVTQALDLIGPFLPKRLNGPADSRYPTWAKWAKRILAEESSNLQQMISIFQFMVRHPWLFYEAREHFIPLIIPALSKIAQLPNPSNEQRRLVLNLIHMIWKWEDRRVRGTDQPSSQRIESPFTRNRKVESIQSNRDSPASNTGSLTNNDRDEYFIPTPLRMMLIKYLGQFISVLPERYPVPSSKLRDLPPKDSPLKEQQSVLPPNDTCKKAMILFHDLLSPGLWADLDVDLFSRMTDVLASDKTDKAEDKIITGVVNTLQLLRVMLNSKPDEWIVSQVGQIRKLIDKPIRLENPEIQDSLHASDYGLDGDRHIKPLLTRVLQALPQQSREEDDMDAETPSVEFLTYLSTAANEMMGAGNNLSSINICWSLAQVLPAEVEQHIPQIMRALQQKLAKDQLTLQPPQPSQSTSQHGIRAGEGVQGALDARELERSTQLILKAIEIISLRMNTLGEHRRPFLIVLASLVERSQNTKICEKILQMVETWIFDWREAWPTLKEKTAVLHKMLPFEQRPDPTLLHKFLDLVIRIYEDPRISRTELTVRLEHAFLVGTRAHNLEVRNRFMTIFDRSLTKSVSARLTYVLTSQNWDTLSENFWLSQAVQLIFGAVDMGTSLQLHQEDFKTIALSQIFGASIKNAHKDDLIIEDQLLQFVSDHKRFLSDLGEVKVQDVLEPLCQLQHTDRNVAYQIWVALFPLCWSLLSRDDRSELEKGMVTLLTKDYHSRQMGERPNVVQALLEGIVRSKPKCKLPPHVMKFLSKTYDAWYTAAISLEETAITPLIDTPSVRESNLDALVEVYAGLQEDDFFYGTWRRRCKFEQTNAALSYEQNGMWEKAQQLYEAAQIKARTGAVPFSQAEYMLWEDHWVLCAQKLQQWDILNDFAKHENFNDLLLESTWRVHENWTGPENMDQLGTIIKAVSDAPTPRRTFFQAFLSLLKFHDKPETQPEFIKICDESIQLTIRKWYQLPKTVTNAHIPILQNFQQLVELHDASIISTSLSQTNPGNLDQKSSELKLLLGTWRDRLPNVWDDINAWQDLVTWRQHIFQLINRTYLALLPNQTTNATGSSYAYRGYHETAWIINRFAHVARKHQLPEVCISQLSRIYTLPNIEIQEAFLKLREQAKCHYQNKAELSNGLDVINNTNLNYFSQQQKAEFFTLKGMFLAKLDQKEEANDAFGTALYYEIRLPKAWAEWGYYNDSMFKLEPNNMDRGSAAVSCYLEAAGLFKNAKSRKLLSRILWLLSIDDKENKITKAFEDFKGETPVWYWITFIPQLLTSLSHREAKLSRAVLLKIAKLFPQSLYFLLRTTREDMLAIKKQQDQNQERLNRTKQPPSAKQDSPNTRSTPNGRPGSSSRPGTANGENLTNGHRPGATELPKHEPNGKHHTTPDAEPETQPPKKPWEYSEEIMAVLKTTFPLLAFSMETMVDQIQKCFKCPPDEDAYRLIVALLNDGLTVSFEHLDLSI